MEESSMVSSGDIPVDIIINMLSRLPMEGLVRCRTVCKLWFNIINDPHFVSTHLLSPSRGFVYLSSIKYKTEQPPKRTKRFNFHVLKLENHVGYYSLHEVWKKSDSPSNIKWRNHFAMDFIGSSKGLVCFKDRRKLHIFNPLFLNYMLTVPLLPSVGVLEQGHQTDESFMSYGFGFDESSKTFKVVCIVMCRDFGDYDGIHTTRTPFVLDLGLGNSSVSETRFRWRALSSPSIRYPCLHGKTSLAVFIDGAFMFLGSRTIPRPFGAVENCEMLLLSFNLGKETFKIIALPKLAPELMTHFRLFDFDGMIGLLGSGIDTIFRVWALINDEWVEDFRFQMPFYCPRLRVAGFDKSEGSIIFEVTTHSWYAYNTQTGIRRTLPMAEGTILPLHQGSLMCASNLTPLDLPS